MNFAVDCCQHKNNRRRTFWQMITHFIHIKFEFYSKPLQTIKRRPRSNWQVSPTIHETEADFHHNSFLNCQNFWRLGFKKIYDDCWETNVSKTYHDFSNRTRIRQTANWFKFLLTFATNVTTVSERQRRICTDKQAGMMNEIAAFEWRLFNYDGIYCLQPFLNLSTAHAFRRASSKKSLSV